MPFGFHLTMDTLPSGDPQAGGFRSALACIRLSLSCPFRLLHTFHLLRPARHCPRVWIWRSSFERQWDFNPPEQRAAQRTTRAPPPPQTARPGPRGLSVDRALCHHRWGFPCCVWSPMSACRRQYPGRTDGIVRPYAPIDCGLPRTYGGSAPALFFSRPAQRSLSLQPARSPSRPKRPSTPEASAASLPPLLLRLLPGGANPFPGGTFPAVDQRLSQRTQVVCIMWWSKTIAR